jgi:predicted transcriptional regulator
VAQEVEAFGTPRGRARSTVLTMMERLRRKGYLTGRPIDGVYHYLPRTMPAAAIRQAVKGFVARTLGGSVADASTVFRQAQLNSWTAGPVHTGRPLLRRAGRGVQRGRQRHGPRRRGAVRGDHQC